MSSDILVSETSQHKTVDKIVLYLHTSTCVQRLEGSIVSSDALRAEVKPAIFGLYIVRNGALMSFAHQQVGECKISGFLGNGGRNCGRGLEGGVAAGPGMLKLSNSSLVFLHKALPFSFTHFWNAWNHCMPAECLTFPASSWWGADQCSLLLCLEPRLSVWMEISPVKVRGSWEDRYRNLV